MSSDNVLPFPPVKTMSDRLQDANKNLASWEDEFLKKFGTRSVRAEAMRVLRRQRLALRNQLIMAELDGVDYVKIPIASAKEILQSMEDL